MLKQKTKSVAVILGDPRKSDPVKRGGKFNEEDLETVNKLKEALNELKEYSFSYFDNHDSLMTDLKTLQGKINFVFNLCDEGLYNNPEREADVPAMLEKLGLAYTGASAKCLVECYDKTYTKGIARKLGINVPEGFLLQHADELIIPSKFPLIVKPNNADGGFGISRKSVVHNLEELIEAIKDVRAKIRKQPIIVEEFLEGADLTVGIIGNPPNCMILPIIEEDYSVIPEGMPKICGYEAKWDPNSPYWKLKSKLVELPERTKETIKNSCLILFEKLECRDYARFDWRLDSEGVPKLLEVNPNPGWCWDGHLAKMCSYAGMSYSKMLASILQAAEKRLRID